MKEDVQPDGVLQCFDEMHRICWEGVWWRTLAGLLCLLASVGVASMADADWIFPLGVVVVIGGLILPHVIKVHRGYACLRCPLCREEVGGYDTNGPRIYLVCKHCGKRTPTDCGMDCEGCPPVKIIGEKC